MASELVIGLIACVCALFVGIYAYVTRNFKHWKKLGVKELEPSFPFGNFGKCIFAKESLHDFFEQTYNEGEGEKMIGFYVLDEPYLMLRDPELLKHVFIKNFNIFSNKLLCGNKCDPFGTHILFLETNPLWSHIRQKLSPMFTSSKLKKNFELMMDIYSDLDYYLQTLAVNDKVEKPVEIRETCAKLMTDIIGITSFNISFNSLRDPEAPFRKFGKDMFRNDFWRYLQILAIFFVRKIRYITNAKFFGDGTEFFENTFSNIVEERIKSGTNRNDFVDLVIDLIKSEENGSTDTKIGHRSCMSQLTGVFSGGFETSSTTASYGLYYIAVHPEIQKMLRDELMEATQKTNGKLTYDAVMNAPYLNMIVRETLRLHPILVWIDRLPDVDYTFPETNVTIKKGTPVIFPIRPIHMDPKYYPEPEKFMPERFSDENKDNHTPFTYSPFGEGPRNCIGMRLGLLQVKLALAYLTLNYEITPCDRTPIPLKIDKTSVLFHPHGDIYLNFKKITS